MLKFFRRIRWRLLLEEDRSEASENQDQSEAVTARATKRKRRLSSYLLYAFGEIALIVIGIMIALQINNWNGKRKASLATKEALKNVLFDLQ